MGTSMAKTVVYSLDLTPVSCVSQPDAGPTAADATDIQRLAQQQHLQHSQKHFQQTFTQPHATARQMHGQGPQLSMQSQQHMTVMSAPQQLMQQQQNNHISRYSSSKPIQQQHHQQSVPISQQQSTQQSSQQTAQQQASRSAYSSQQRVMLPPVTATGTRSESSPTPLTSTPAGFTFSPPPNPPSVDSHYFTNIPNTSQDVSFGPSARLSSNQLTKHPPPPRDQPAAGDQPLPADIFKGFLRAISSQNSYLSYVVVIK